MKIEVIQIILAIILYLTICTLSNKTETQECPDYRIQHGDIDHGSFKIVDSGDNIDLSQQTIHITCDPGFDLIGPPKVWCVDGQWEQHVRPHCVARCTSPPTVIYGTVDVEGEAVHGLYRKGALATYRCNAGFFLSPPESMYRVCEKGIWTGPVATCQPIGCEPPKTVINGYYVQEKNDFDNPYAVGQRLHYSCASGYTLVGDSAQLCLEDRTWSPKIQPVCISIDDDRNISDEDSCQPAPLIPHTITTIISGFHNSEMAIAGTEMEVRCIPKYRNNKTPCSLSTKIRCVNGRWLGDLPTCVPAKDCLPPPVVPHAHIWYINNFFAEPDKISHYPIHARIAYQCWPGYEPEGNSVAECSNDGCWSPSTPPVCKKSLKYLIQMGNAGSTVISMVTGAGILVLLFIACLAVICSRRKPLSRPVTIPPPVPMPRTTETSDHVSLLNHPDRLALIAYADGVQNGSQPALPSYEEAIRDQRPSLTSNRLHRPHWPFLAQRRARNSPEGAHVTRQGSFASHSASTRSGGDPMGSTDTMVVSEGSTAITLDTVSSHSGSQTASCRAHCGSLASFDTSSVHNTEGVPLLEESEHEDGNIDNHSLAIENRSMTDNNSAKLSMVSPDVP
ncbi:sushi, von Willebrand factor type A, EGF and pentraxin domain-containing protein 1 [Agrilus planipennis]|uniref:Sushi, von Willebrand factor type A, EGF and pentraxin domain-containing protein 1 n=1 Tax=Agrilus planipennis TaxID=224129 RepID=A0A7F5RLG1_AGRPL|nr:sushi, von Willebrand factor type A, EGF and pentraxin domain-containing protein 1 [Agrilus planipennis]